MKQTAFLLSFLGIIVFSECSAQMSSYRVPPRIEDQFQKWRLVRRINLDEKINRPLVQTAATDIYESTGHTYSQGMVAALIAGLREGKYVGYSPDNLNEPMDEWDMMKKAERIFPRDSEIEEWDPDPEINYDPSDPDNSEITLDPSDPEGDQNPDVFEYTLDTKGSEDWFEISAFENVVELIEDRIFDKNRSDIVHDIKFIRLVWVDPMEELPDENFICFRYEDVIDVLNNTLWKNPYNSAEDRSIKQVLEQRIFNSYVTNVSGKGVRTLDEAQYREQQLIEFEHELYSW